MSSDSPFTFRCFFFLLPICFPLLTDSPFTFCCFLTLHLLSVGLLRIPINFKSPLLLGYCHQIHAIQYVVSFFLCCKGEKNLFSCFIILFFFFFCGWRRGEGREEVVGEREGHFAYASLNIQIQWNYSRTFSTRMVICNMVSLCSVFCKDDSYWLC